MDAAKPETLPAVNGNGVQTNGEQDVAAYHRNAITSVGLIAVIGKATTMLIPAS